MVIGEEETIISRFYFRGGNRALDFLNTVGNQLNAEKRRDYFAVPEDVMLWAKAAGLRVKGKRGFEEADLRRVRGFREALYRIFRAQLENEEAGAGDLALLNRALRRLRATTKLVQRKEGFAWRGKLRAADQLLGLVAESAAELLISRDLDRVRMCADEECGWLFIDRSRSRPRKWCSMEDCGNRAKQRRYQERG